MIRRYCTIPLQHRTHSLSTLLRVTKRIFSSRHASGGVLHEDAEGAFFRTRYIWLLDIDAHGTHYIDGVSDHHTR